MFSLENHHCGLLRLRLLGEAVLQFKLALCRWQKDMPIEADMVDNGDKTPESDHALSTNSYDIWLNLPDVPFNVFMMSLSITDLRRLTQVSSSWKNRITETFLKNPANQKTLRARIDRAMGPGMLPSNEEITNAMWLSKYL